MQTVNTMKASEAISPKYYIVDYLNIFSDFREIKYKKCNVDFHSVKHNNKEQDTIDFFNLFFSKYIEYVNIDKDSIFIFVMKKLYGYEATLGNIVKQNSSFNIRFMIIEDKYNNGVLDKNKDDFLCQYIFYTLQKNSDCTLISNDKYRDRQKYIKLFTFDMRIQIITWNEKDQKIKIKSERFVVDRSWGDAIVRQTCRRCTIPKHKLDCIL
jgi:hypothetical protein